MTKAHKIAVVIPAYNEEKTILSALESLSAQDFDRPLHLVIIDNNSNDSTRQIAESYVAKFPYQMSVISEPTKGTGVASRTGFQYAIKNGAEIIARVDADSIPSADWLKNGLKKFDNQSTHMVGGRCRPLRDKNYRFGDTMMVRLGELPMRLLVGFSSMLRKPQNWRAVNFAIGSNMFIRASSYQAVGGFKPTAIDQADEDIDLSVQIMNEYGFLAICHARRAVVDISMRRMRELGWLRTIVHHVVGPYSKLARSKRDVR